MDGESEEVWFNDEELFFSEIPKTKPICYGDLIIIHRDKKEIAYSYGALDKFVRIEYYRTNSERFIYTAFRVVPCIQTEYTKKLFKNKTVNEENSLMLEKESIDNHNMIEQCINKKKLTYNEPFFLVHENSQKFLKMYWDSETDDFLLKLTSMPDKFCTFYFQSGIKYQITSQEIVYSNDNVIITTLCTELSRKLTLCPPSCMNSLSDQNKVRSNIPFLKRNVISKSKILKGHNGCTSSWKVRLIAKYDENVYKPKFFNPFYINSSNIPATLSVKYTHFNSTRSHNNSIHTTETNESNANYIEFGTGVREMKLLNDEIASDLSNLEANDSVIFQVEKNDLEFNFKDSSSQKFHSAYNLFYFEYIDKFDFPSFDKIYWCDKVRIKHYLTDNYLAVEMNERHPGFVTTELSSLKDYDYDSCTFRLIDVIPEKDSKWSQTLNVKTGFLVKHVKTNLYLSLEIKDYNYPREADFRGILSLSKHPNENDIFTIQTLENEKILDVNFIKNAYSFIKYYISVENEFESISILTFS
jgi:hypothetical protein